MDEKSFIERMLSLTSEWEISFSSDQAEVCYRHVTLMLEWNKKTNLTRITDSNEILVKHLLDSLIPARWLPKSGFFLDIGTGPGFPGIPLKILNPESELVLLESNGKKASFLKVLISKLKLEKVTVMQARLEEIGKIELSPSGRLFDAAVMRAVHLERGYLEILDRFVLKPGAVFGWWAGPLIGSEKEHPVDEGSIRFEKEFSYALPLASKARRLLLWRKKDR